MKSLFYAAATALFVVSQPQPARAALEAVTQFYTCDRGVWIPATYINERSDDPDAGAMVVMLIENRQITLWAEVSASGARYGWPSDGSHYVWWTKGDEATLYWHDGTNDEDTVVVGGCSIMAQTE